MGDLYKAYQRLRARERAARQLGIPFPQAAKRMMEIEPRQPEQHLRLVGCVMPEPSRYRVNGVYWEGAEHYGWFTDPHGDVFRDGSGLCWGVVMQLPGKNGKARLIAGYEFGGCDFGVTLDFTQVFEVDAQEASEERVSESFDAARHADNLARVAADKERAYQREQQEEDEIA